MEIFFYTSKIITIPDKICETSTKQGDKKHIRTKSSIFKQTKRILGIEDMSLKITVKLLKNFFPK